MITFFLAGGFTNNEPLFLSDSDSEDEDDFTALEEYKKHRAEYEQAAQPSERISPNTFTEKNYIDVMNALNHKVRKSMQNLWKTGERKCWKAFMVEIFRLIFVSRKTMEQWRQEICNKRVEVSINTKVRLILVHGSWFLHRVLGHV